MECVRRAAGIARSFPRWLQDHNVAAVALRQTGSAHQPANPSLEEDSLRQLRQDESGATEQDTVGGHQNWFGFEPGFGRRKNSRVLGARDSNPQQEQFSFANLGGYGSSLGVSQLREHSLPVRQHGIPLRHSRSWWHRLWFTQSGSLARQSDQRCWALGRVALAHTKAESEPAAEIDNDPDKLPLELRKRRAPRDARAVPPTKVCTDCKNELPAVDFAWRTTSPDGLDFRCRGCYAVASYAARGRVFPGVRVLTKACTRCGQVRPGTFFAVASNTPDGLQNRCRTCAAEANTKRLVRLTSERAKGARFDDQPGTTTCSKCARELPTEVFHQDPYSLTGRSLACPQCCSVRVVGRRKTMERPSGPLVTEKRCSTCREVKPADEFYFHAYAADGLTFVCKACNNQSVRFRRKNGEPGLEAEREDTRQSM